MDLTALQAAVESERKNVMYLRQDYVELLQRHCTLLEKYEALLRRHIPEETSCR